MTQRDNFFFGDKLSEYYYIVSYVSNKEDVDNSSWDPPKISAVQLAAAITACSRIHMYKYISRPDCYYTDTDSAILGSPLPEEEVSSIELGKLKMEYFVKKAKKKKFKKDYFRKISNLFSGNWKVCRTLKKIRTVELLCWGCIILKCL